MIKKLCTLLLLTCITAAPSLAQRYSSSDDASFAPKKGQWQVSVLLGSGKFFNENTSYLLPKFTNTIEMQCTESIPKGTDFRKLTDEFIHSVQLKLNRRPRKKLNFSTPKDEFFRFLL